MVLAGPAPEAVRAEEVEVIACVRAEAEGGSGEHVEDDGKLGVEVPERGGDAGPADERQRTAGGGDVGGQELGAEQHHVELAEAEVGRVGECRRLVEDGLEDGGEESELATERRKAPALERRERGRRELGRERGEEAEQRRTGEVGRREERSGERGAAPAPRRGPEEQELHRRRRRRRGHDEETGAPLCRAIAGEDCLFGGVQRWGLVGAG